MTLLYWLPALLYMAGIFYVSSLPDVGPMPGGMSDKSLHGLAYAGLGVLLLYALARGRPAAATWRRGLLAVLLATAYGASDEWHQSFVPGRSSELADIVADAGGAACGVALALAAATVAKRREARSVA